MLMIIISIFGIMLYHVISTRNQLIFIKQDLTDIQNGVITIDEATHIPEGFAYTRLLYTSCDFYLRGNPIDSKAGIE